jgi:UDP-N-acetylmuramyl pentapeptide phosphotransferase/UDP-N-acetylglucosamine-1-phosphate transferase
MSRARDRDGIKRLDHRTCTALMAGLFFLLSIAAIVLDGIRQTAASVVSVVILMVAMGLWARCDAHTHV